MFDESTRLLERERDELADSLQKTRAELEAVKRERDGLRTALTPFSKMAEELECLGNDDVVQLIAIGRPSQVELRVGDARRAREALRGGEE